MKTPSVAVIVISKGRPVVLKETLEGLLQQTLKPSQIIAVVTCDDDFPVQTRPDFVEVYKARASTCIQRNHGLEKVRPDTDYVTFLDDDYELKPDFLQKAVTFLNDCPGIVAMCGKLLSDGGLTRQQAQQLIADYKEEERFEGSFIPSNRSSILSWGCTTIRKSAMTYEKFDENLPLYAYGEDYDLSIRLRRYGIIGRYKGCLAVHLRTPSGRVREVQHGYAMIANNWHMLKKDVCHLPPRLAWLRFWVIFFIKHQFLVLLRIMKRDSSTDWVGQGKGARLAVGDILRGRCTPSRMLDFSK